MIARLTIVLALALVAGPADAAHRAAARHTAPATSARAAATPTPAPAPPAHGAAARTLDDIHIEGEIPVPQVLFITARDQRRFLDFQHRRFRRTSRQLGEDTALPSWIVVTGARTPAKETAR